MSRSPASDSAGTTMRSLRRRSRPGAAGRVAWRSQLGERELGLTSTSSTRLAKPLSLSPVIVDWSFASASSSRRRGWRRTRPPRRGGRRTRASRARAPRRASCAGPSGSVARRGLGERLGDDRERLERALVARVLLLLHAQVPPPGRCWTGSRIRFGGWCQLAVRACQARLPRAARKPGECLGRDLDLPGVRHREPDERPLLPRMRDRPAGRRGGGRHAQDGHGRVRRRGRLDRTRARARPESLLRVMARYFDGDAGGRSSATAAPSRSSSATRSWPSSASRGSTRTTPCAPCAPRPRCARRSRALNEELERTGASRSQMRTGVNTGEVVAGDPAARPGARHRRRRQRRRAAGAGRRARRDPARRRDLPAGARRGVGRAPSGRSQLKGKPVPRGGLARCSRSCRTRAAGHAPASTRRSSAATASSSSSSRRFARVARERVVRGWSPSSARPASGKSRLDRRARRAARRPSATVVGGAACPTARASRSGRSPSALMDAAGIAERDRPAEARAQDRGPARRRRGRRARRRAARARCSALDPGRRRDPGDVLGGAQAVRAPRRASARSSSSSTTSSGASRRSSTSLEYLADWLRGAPGAARSASPGRSCSRSARSGWPRRRTRRR